MRDPTSAALPGYPGYSMPQATFLQYANIGRNLRDSLIRNGEIDTVVVGDRARHVIMESWHAHLARRLAGVERDPVDKQRAIESYKRSLERSKGARATALARSGWGPDHGKKGGSPHLTSRRAASPERASPPPAAAPKTAPAKTRSSRKETVAPVQ
jgi:hypothetical protein